MIVHKNLHPSISRAQDVFLPFQSKFCINQPDLNQTQLRCSKGSESDQPVTHRHKIGADAVTPLVSMTPQDYCGCFASTGFIAEPGTASRFVGIKPQDSASWVRVNQSGSRRSSTANEAAWSSRFACAFEILESFRL